MVSFSAIKCTRYNSARKCHPKLQLVTSVPDWLYCFYRSLCVSTDTTVLYVTLHISYPANYTTQHHTHLTRDGLWLCFLPLDAIVKRCAIVVIHSVPHVCDRGHRRRTGTAADTAAGRADGPTVRMAGRNGIAASNTVATAATAASSSCSASSSAATGTVSSGRTADATAETVRSRVRMVVMVLDGRGW